MTSKMIKIPGVAALAVAASAFAAGAAHAGTPDPQPFDSPAVTVPASADAVAGEIFGDVESDQQQGMLSEGPATTVGSDDHAAGVGDEEYPFEDGFHQGDDTDG